MAIYKPIFFIYRDFVNPWMAWGMTGAISSKNQRRDGGKDNREVPAMHD